MRSTTIVFRGVAQVVAAYEANDIGPWAIANGNDILCADNVGTVEEGRAMLEETLNRLRTGNSKAAFDLRVYKIKQEIDIEPQTKHFRAFRFSLYEDAEMTPWEHGRQKTRDDYEGRFAVMQQEIQELKLALAKAEEGEPEEEGMSVNKMISGFMEQPQIKQALTMRLLGLIDKVIPMNVGTNANRPAAIAGVPQQQTGQSLLDQEQMEKAQAAINVLASVDAKLGDHLTAIAKIAAEDPKKYIWLTAMLG